MTARSLLIPLLTSCFLLAGTSAVAQNEIPSEFDSGNDYFPVHVYFGFLEQGAPVVMACPGEGLSGVFFRDRPDGGTSWMEQLAAPDRGFTAYSFDWPGTGAATDILNRDYIRALKAHVEGAHTLAHGGMPRLSIAHAEGAAVLIKIRSFGDYLSRTAVLIDPIGPQHAQPLEEVTFEEALAREATSEDDLWRRWGFGPRVGELGDGLDIDLETATRVFDAYERDAFPIRPALLQPMISPIRVRGPGRLDGWRVLVVRTPAADEAQVAREQAMTAWLREANVHVELLDLASDPALSGTTGLPWIGSLAPDVLDRILEWHHGAIRLVPPIRDLETPGQS